jgi:hypothetical protein
MERLKRIKDQKKKIKKLKIRDQKRWKDLEKKNKFEKLKMIRNQKLLKFQDAKKDFNL